MKKYIYVLIFPLLSFSMAARAHVELLYPEGGNSFNSGDSIVISWVELATHDTQNWELYYSPDGGENWEVISKNIPYPLREYSWEVPAEATTKGRVKIFMNNLEDTDYEDISANFTIETTTGTGADEAAGLLFESFKIIPNPVRSNSRFQFETDQQGKISIDIYNLAGVKIDEIPARFFTPGLYSIPWNAPALKPGIYFYVVQSGNERNAYRFQKLP
ncbi:MAG: T9SS type A sorting domain-containing protein [Bacteroidales bacterium]|nr:T9SS type A sorting domain-containing protein [Bacteroidales bacterium]MCF6342815.1 T9SS type A sorting domain-containing protein [Bacteroidales bacterium]